MDNKTNLNSHKGISKLKELVDDIKICLFCTNLRTDDGSTCRPMSTQGVDDEGNLWFFSGIDSDKNREIVENKNVQLFFGDPGKSSYLVVNGEAEIILDRNKIEEHWNPLVKVWFKGGKDDPNLSLLKVIPNNSYYWDVDGNRMVNFAKMLISTVTGSNLVTSEEGAINI